MKSFSEKVQNARKLIGLSQQELGDIIGVSARSIYSWETKGVRPRPTTLRKLAEALQVSAQYLELDDITDPTYGIERKPYVDETFERFGSKAAKELEFMIEKSNALFAGGVLSDEAKDLYFQAVMKAYMKCKEDAKCKFSGKQTTGQDSPTD